ncbi:deoxyguanosinetriphosphate triphosphohydrolase [Desulfurispora thermophila]|uniref:deoxyguanosinetriphosphate triphosphohydrolase n=1 Tax=Desulfurispora thermophila TaxID=265470 RepID=UPI000363E8FE|nr:deoxyguanosinetriphosphate triphosphohydrolase [Desulfurispora thermophila]
MQWREMTEEREEKLLSSRACLSRKSRGRIVPEEACPVRTCFQRDRDRIIHAKSFRRLKHKTQVFIIPEGDHIRTRLTHTLEVAQISRTVARALSLNEDLTEAIALGHDLGHTPFGHAGEDVLNRIHPGGFKHNEQSLRVVDLLEGRQGLNLTWEVRDGILNHTGPNLPATLEGQIVRICDRIAYINHDIDDALRAGILTPEQLPRDCLAVLGQTHRERINNMIMDLIIHNQDSEQIALSPAFQKAADKLRDFMFARVYIGSEAKREEHKAMHVVEFLYKYFASRFDLLPDEYRHRIDIMGVDRVVCDYIAGMTDRYAISMFSDLFIPRAFSNIVLEAGK